MRPPTSRGTWRTGDSARTYALRLPTYDRSIRRPADGNARSDAGGEASALSAGPRDAGAPPGSSAARGASGRRGDPGGPGSRLEAVRWFGVDRACNDAIGLRRCAHLAVGGFEAAKVSAIGCGAAWAFTHQIAGRRMLRLRSSSTGFESEPDPRTHPAAEPLGRSRSHPVPCAPSDVDRRFPVPRPSASRPAVCGSSSLRLPRADVTSRNGTGVSRPSGSRTMKVLASSSR